MDTIYVIDDEKELCLTIKKVLESEGFHVDWTTEPREFLQELLPHNRFSCVLLDLKLKEESGMDYVQKIMEVDPHLPIIMITAYETVKTAVQAMRQGVFHYLSKPFDNEELKVLIAKAVEIRRLYWQIQDLKEKKTEGLDLQSAMGYSDVIQALEKQVKTVAQTDVHVLLTGESGTGKELLANSIHRFSPRKDGPFIPVDCASIPESLIESELFGHEKGAFTGAHIQRKGKLEMADRGTLFLDEISNMPLSIQAKLLRFLETLTFERLGGRTPLKVSCRVIAATNREIQKMIEQKEFRQDLYHRLNEFPITVPPLRERIEDIRFLGLKFLQESHGQIGKKITEISESALRTLQAYPWPGNVRELRNVIKRAMVMASHRIEKADLPAEVKNPIQTGLQNELTVSVTSGASLPETVKEAVRVVEKKLIRDSLQLAEGRKGKAAQLLKIDEKTLYNKLKEYKIP